MRILILIIIILINFNPKASATHIMGGEVYYECLDPATNKYRFTVKLYRDCYNGVPAFDDPIFVSLYDTNDNLVIKFNMALPPDDTLDNNTYNVCLYSPPDICVHEATYQEDFFLPPGEFYMTYQRCCRTIFVLNLDTPQVAGYGFDIRIPDSSEAYCNSSPYFNNNPPTITCLNEPFAYDHSATDPDGDSLVYYLCTPNEYNTSVPPSGLGIIPDPPGPPSSNYDVTYLFPYESAYPIWAPNDSFVIDPVTGWMTGTPTQSGNYVVAVCVSEYRNGIFLSTNTRDFLFSVAQCLSDPNLGFMVQPDPCDNLKVNFMFTGNNAVQSFFWDFGDSSTNLDTSVLQNPSYTFPDTGTYQVMLVVNQDYTCADTLTINVTPPNALMANFSLVSCSGDTVVFQDESVTNAYAGSITSWTWNFGDASSSTAQNPSHVYASAGTYSVMLITTTANNCVDTIQVNVVTGPCEIIGQKELAEKDFEFSIYPNPSRGQFNIDFASAKPLNNIELKIYSADGKMVYSKLLVARKNNNRYLIVLEEMQNGVYFLKIVTDGEVATRKIILQ
ncbi:MAG: hypothetical protein COB85_03345 [Bacteroidetes bacterium]|nr:MAG: hypothetical protein COB85_03345 [Bacteroidota bacterium]